MPEKSTSEDQLRAVPWGVESFSFFHRLLYYAVPVLTLLLARRLLPVTLSDDAFITFKVALNTASGLGMVFNPGENTYVSTSPAWVLLLAASRWLVGDVVLAAKMLGTVFEILLALTIVRFGARTRAGPAAGMFAALLLLTNPVFLLTSFSGMELPLYLLVIVLTALLLFRHQYPLAMALAAGSVWVRFDGVVVLGVAVTIFLWNERRQLRRRPARVLAGMMPAVAIFVAYVLFGAVFFETWIPMSVLRKALTSADLLSPEWLGAARDVSLEFIKAFLGKSAYWYTHDTAFPLLVIPFVAGVVFHFRYKDMSTAPLVLITIAYAGAFAGSGSSYAVNFPWYFVPVLPAACLVCGTGITWMLSAISSKSPFLKNTCRAGVLPALVAMCWLAISITPLKGDADTLVNIWKKEREEIYAAAAVWAGRHVGHDLVVAANEIGTIGFFLPPGATMIDMFGLLSRKDRLHVPFDQRIEEQLPQCIFTRAHFSYTQTLQSKMQESYRWFRFRTLNLGIRSDLVASLQPLLSEFHAIYETINIDSEYPWDTVSGNYPGKQEG